jgi:lipid A 4'-phosphatase
MTSRLESRPASARSFGLTSPRTTLLIILAIGAATGLVFGLRPDFDYRLVGLLYDAPHREWYFTGSTFISRYRDFNYYTAVVLGVVATCALILAAVRKPWTLMSGRTAAFLLGSLIVGPGLITNALLKPHWGRPRPDESILFKGNLEFVPWWNPFGSCDSNCSFVSGEVSSACWLLAWAVILPERYRIPAVIVVSLHALAIGVTRMALGGHFPSDVLFAGVFTALAIWFVHRLVFQWIG